MALLHREKLFIRDVGRRRHVDVARSFGAGGLWPRYHSQGSRKRSERSLGAHVLLSQGSGRGSTVSTKCSIGAASDLTWRQQLNL